MSDFDKKLTSAVDKWQKDLVAQRIPPRHLSFASASKNAVELQMQGSALWELVQSRTPVSLRPVDEDAEERTSYSASRVTSPGALQTRNTTRELAARSATIRAAYLREYQDSGVENCYLTFGILKWKGPDESSYVSPLILVPGEVAARRGHAATFQLSSDGDLSVNIALTLRLKSEYALDLPGFDLDENLDLDTWLDSVDEIAKRRGWRVERDSYISNFNFTHEAMYRDIERNLEAIRASDLVRGLIATGEDEALVPGFDIDFAEAGEIDSVAPPEDSKDILPSDSSQRVCIDAVRKGKSFVMQGPPGTGKTQTIANMVANLIYDGKSVLFVSEKRTALEAVREKLVEHHLGDYTLVLFGKGQSRAAFAKSLNDALGAAEARRAQRPRSAAATAAASRSARAGLSDYADAVNCQVGSWLLTFSQLVGLATQGPAGTQRGSALLGAKLAAEPPDRVQSIKDAVKYAAECWPLRVTPRDCVWWGLSNAEAVGGAVKSLNAALLELGRLRSSSEDVGHATETVEKVKQVASRLPDVPPVPSAVDGLVSLSEVKLLAGHIQAALRLTESAGKAGLAAGFDSTQATEMLEQIPTDWEARIAGVPSEMSLEDLNDLVGTLRIDADQVRNALVVAPGIADKFGLPSISTWYDVLGLAEQLETSNRRIRPSWYWFRAGEASRAQLSGFQARVASALEAASEAAYGVGPNGDALVLLDLQQVAEQLNSGSGWTRRWMPAYRRALDAVREADPTVTSGEAAVAKLKAATALEVARRDLDACGQHELMRSFQPLSATDWPEILEALNVAGRILFDTQAGTSPYLIAPLNSPLFHEGPRPLEDDREAEGAYRSIERLRSRKDNRLLTALLDMPLDEVPDALARKADELQEVARLQGLLRHITRVATVGDLRVRIRAAETLLQVSQALRESLADLDGRYVFNDTRQAAIDASALETLGNCAETLGLTCSLKDFERDFLSGGELAAAAESVQVNLAAVIACFEPSKTNSALQPSARLDQLANHVLELDEALAELPDWQAHMRTAGDLDSLGLNSALEAAYASGALGRDAAAAIWSHIAGGLVEFWLQDDSRVRPSISDSLDNRVSDFRELDREVQILAAAAVAAAQDERISGLPESAKGPLKAAAVAGPRTKHPRITHQVQQHRSYITTVKPVFMMNPISVSQYLPPDMTFDYVIYDEASQLLPGHVLTSLYRGKSVVIAGDPKQMPPPNYGAFELDDEDRVDEDVSTLAATVFESVLTLAIQSPAFDERMLRWHYRSRNEALIAFSNLEFYDGRLYTFPSARALSADPGVEFRHVSEGKWIRGGYGKRLQGCNPVEAAVVVEEVRAFARQNPVGVKGSKSLMIISPGKGQMEEISDQLAAARREDEALDRFMADTESDTALLQKNLETVQGDERDVVFFSFAYNDRGADGKVAMNFGPLISAGGERRFNVAITRARERLVFFSGVRAGDITDDASKPERMVIKRYLDYAERGVEALQLRSMSQGGSAESPFEEAVADFLRDHGYEVVPQVGTAGYRVDMGVIHPRFPGAFVLGVECDGYQYHSAAAARDRDRIRQEVLEGLGWTMHRIWGTKWYRQTKLEKARLLHVLEELSKRDPVGRFS